MRPRARRVVRPAPRPPLPRNAHPRHNCGKEESMFACLHGPGNLTALAFEFSPTVEQTADDTVAFDVSGLDRLFGLPQDVAHAIARRAAELQLKVSLALAGNPDAAICAARGFSG